MLKCAVGTERRGSGGGLLGWEIYWETTAPEIHRRGDAVKKRSSDLQRAPFYMLTECWSVYVSKEII